MAFGKIKTSAVKALGKQTRWTRELLLATLETAVTNPRVNIFWNEFSWEEKLSSFDMIDWAASYPDDIPSRSLLFEDPWSTWV